MTPQKEISLVKGNDRFIFRYTPGDEEQMLDAFVSLANQRSNAFDWFDAAVLSFQLSKHLVEEADKLLCPDSGASVKPGSENEGTWIS